MKFSTALLLCVSASFLASPAMAGDDIPLQMREDTEYMMRKVAEDIRMFNVTTTVTDKTRDEGIEVVGYALEFIDDRKDEQTGAIFSCAFVSLKANMRSGKSAREQITRTDEVCTNASNEIVNYVPNVR